MSQDVDVTVRCPWCTHTEVGTGYRPHDAMTGYYAGAHVRRQRCGCEYVDGVMWCCDQHITPWLSERNDWRLANYRAGRWLRHPAQPSLLLEQADR